jgi:lipopolysaccharide transport system permease protein
MQQVYVPKVVFPIVSVLADTLKFLVVFSLLVVVMMFWHQAIPLSFVAVPLVILVQALLATALALLLAAITPIVPDLRVVLENVLRLWFFLSGVFYSVEQLPEQFHFYLRLNPMTVILEAYRDILLHGRWPDLAPLGIWGLICSAGCWMAYRLIARLDYLYPRLRL